MSVRDEWADEPPPPAPEAFQEGFEGNVKDRAPQKAAFDKMLALVPDVKAGSTMMFAYVPGKGTTLSAGSKELGVFEGKARGREQPRPVRPCSRCGREAPIFRLQLEDLVVPGQLENALDRSGGPFLRFNAALSTPENHPHAPAAQQRP